MKCKQVQKLLQSFIDDDLSESVSRQVKSHLRRCPDCAALKRDFESLTRLARSEPAREAPPDFHHLLRRRLAQGSGRRLGWLPSPLAWSTATAVIMVAVAMASLLLENRRGARPPAPAPVSESGITSVVLPADPGTPGTHVFVPGEQEGVLVRVPSTVTITRTQLTQDFFLSEVSH